jgi:hypothetical protein
MVPRTIPAMPPPEMVLGQLQLSDEPDEDEDCRAWRMLDRTGAYVGSVRLASVVPRFGPCGVIQG